MVMIMMIMMFTMMMMNYINTVSCYTATWRLLIVDTATWRVVSFHAPFGSFYMDASWLFFYIDLAIWCFVYFRNLSFFPEHCHDFAIWRLFGRYCHLAVVELKLPLGGCCLLAAVETLLLLGSWVISIRQLLIFTSFFVCWYRFCLLVLLG